MTNMRALLDWYAAAGITTAEEAAPTNLYDWPAAGHRMPKPGGRFKLPPPSASPSADHAPVNRETSGDEQAAMSTDEAIAVAKSLAASASSIEALDEIIHGFNGCPLKSGARNTVIYDGVPRAPLLIIGEAPGREEDRLGKPFVGRAGVLLDKMLASIGMSRQPEDGLKDACITNAIYWRPPGNRTPTKAEVAVCLPFVERFIALSAPRLIVLTGNVPTQTLYPGAPGITRSRGAWREWLGPDGEPIPVLPMFHPAFLLRQPTQKRLAWADLRSVASRLQAKS
ncbi:MAG: uracil-DNA glycosylase [Pseudomonadota bacterium]